MEENDININGTTSTTTTTIKFESEDFEDCKSSPHPVQPHHQLRLLQLATAIPIDNNSSSIHLHQADSSNINFKLEPEVHHSFTNLMSCERISVSIPGNGSCTSTTNVTSVVGGGVGHQHQVDDLCEFSSDLDYAFADLPSSSTTATSAESNNLINHCQDQDDFQENNNPESRSNNHHRRRRRSRPQTSSSLKRRSSSSSSNGGGNGSGNSSSSSRPRIKKQITHDELMAQRNQANIRERQRTQSLNEAFNSLRTSIPTMPSDKMSKIQTLKLASDYIDFLYTVLRTNEENPNQIADISSNHHNEIARASTTASQRARDRDTLGMAFNMWRMQDVWNGKQDMDFIHNNPELV